MLAIWVKVRIGAGRAGLPALRSDVYYFYEIYRDQAALEAHHETPHYALWRGMADVLEGPLALSSAAGAIRRLGGTRWQWLRRLVYAIGLWPTEPTRCRPVFPAAPSYWGQGR